MYYKKTPGQRIAIATALILAGLNLVPMVWMFILAASQVNPNSGRLHPDLSALNRLMATLPVWRWAFNSVVIALISTTTNLLFCSMAGYAFAVKTAPGLKLMFWFCLATMMVPAQVTIIPLFLMVGRAGLINTYTGLALPSLVTGFGVFMMRQFIGGIPRSLFEAARLDGGGEWIVFTRILLPLTRPAMAVLGIFVFSSNWNDFLWPMLVSNQRAMWTLPVGLAALKNELNVDTSLMMAGAAFAALPIIVGFILLQRYFLSGLTIGAVKG